MFLVAWSEALQGPLRYAGRLGETTALHAGGLARLAYRSFVVALRRRVPLRETLSQCYLIGVESVPLVLVTGALSGVVTAQQTGYQFSGSLPLYILGSIVGSSMVLELGPIMTAFVLISRVGARIAAELGTMHVSEQVDALESLGRDPIAELAAPRVIASALMTPLLVGLADVSGVMAGMIAADLTMGLSHEKYLFGVRVVWHSWDLFYSLIKGLVFGLVIAIVGCHAGLATKGGAAGVGRATTNAVVLMLATVLLLDAIFPALLLQ